MKALSYRRSIPRYLAVRALGSLWRDVCTSALSPLHLRELAPPLLPGPDWVRVKPRLSGICGSDLATVTAKGSPYFSGVTSLPFVPGHEVVGDVVELGAAGSDLAIGARVVIEPALGCCVRAVAPLCAACAAGNAGNCVNVGDGAIAPGIQTGYCRSTGGGFSGSLVAHRSQVHAIPEAMSDEDAVMVEPYACALHAVLSSGVTNGMCVLVIGAGSVGLLTTLALRRMAPGATIWVAARHAHQAALAAELGASDVLSSDARLRAEVVLRTGAKVHHPELGPDMVLGGVDLTFDCVGSSGTVDESIRLTRSRGTVMVVGMPSRLDRIDGTALWYQETMVKGAYAYGSERVAGRDVRTFALALDHANAAPGVLGRLVTSRFGLEDYRRAFAVALRPGAEGGVKVVFDLR